MPKKNKKIIPTLIIVFLLIGLFSFWLGYSGTAGQLLPNTVIFGYNVTDNHLSLNAVLGRTDTGNFQNIMTSDKKGGSAFAATATGQLSDIYAYMQYQTNPGYVQAALYADSAGVPTTLLGVSTVQSLPASFSWIDFSFSPLPSVTYGTTYWLCILRQVDAYIMADNTVINNQWNYNPYANGFSNPFGPSNPNPMELCIYGVIQTSSPTPSPTATASPTATPYNPNPTPTPIPTAIPTPTPIPQVTLTIGTLGQGTTNPTSGTYHYNQGSTVPISASPATGYTFTYWLMGDNTKIYTASTSLTMSASQSALAVFTAIPVPTASPLPGQTSAPTPTATAQPTPIPIQGVTNPPTTGNLDEFFMVLGASIIALDLIGTVVVYVLPGKKV